jgi:sugar-specific transcriptional regulator TrmB
MHEPELTEILEDAGLSPYQADAYVTVLELGSASATDIADASDVPDPRIYDVLRDLEKRGYVETYEQDSLHARAHNPETVLADLRERADRFEDAAEEIETLWDAPEMDSHTVSFLTRIDTVLDKAEAKIGAATDQIEVAASLEQFRRLEPAIRAAHDRGVHVRLVIHVDEEGGETLPAESTLAALSSEVRYRTIPMPFLVLVDRTATCFAPHALSTNRYGIIVEDRTHAYVFHWFFMAGLWEAAAAVVDPDDTLPRTYVNVRKCIRDVGPLVETGSEITVTVDALDVETGETVTVEGTIVDVEFPCLEAAEARDHYLGGQATIVLDVDDRIVEIGGWGAVMEDYEATRIVVERIDD